MHAPASRPFPCASSGAVMAAGTERAGAGMTAYKAYREVRRIAVLGCGTIGASWAAYFLARGYDVAAWDPAPGWEARLRGFVDNALPQLLAVGRARKSTCMTYSH